MNNRKKFSRTAPELNKFLININKMYPGNFGGNKSILYINY